MNPNFAASAAVLYVTPRSPEVEEQSHLVFVVILHDADYQLPTPWSVALASTCYSNPIIFV